ncbi:MAG: N-acetylneuraminate synthase family protein [Thermodesulfobacteriota bacterium]
MSEDATIRPIPFGRRAIGPGLPVVVIAEIGINHEGDPATCLRLVEAAAKAGADAVKLQTVKAAENYAPGTESYEIFRRAELAEADTARAFARARDLGMECFTTCGDAPSLEFVASLAPAAWKISSGLLTHLPLIRRAAATGRTLLLSTGMTGMAEARMAVDTARAAGAKHLGLFQCTSLYPAPPETLHLRAIPVLAREFGAPAGLSDHSAGSLAPALAVACGACMIEKHFSLDPSRPGFDHATSLDPAGFADMVRTVRLAEAMLGSADKPVPPAVAANAAKYLRCLAARRDIPEGKMLEPADLAVLRLSAGRCGLPPEALDTVPGRRARRALSAYSAITEEDLS